MTVPSEASHQIRGKYVTAPSTPFRVDCLCQFGPGTVGGDGSGGTGSNMGLFLRESSTGELVTITIRLDNNQVMWRMNSPTSFNAVIDSAHEFNADRLWVTIEDNGTNILGRTSVDGVNFINLWSDPRTAFMAGGANQVGFFVQSGNGTAGALFHFHGLRFS